MSLQYQHVAGKACIKRSRYDIRFLSEMEVSADLNGIPLLCCCNPATATL